MALLGRFFYWRSALVVVKPDPLIRWRRKGFRLFRRWKSGPRGRPRLPVNLRELVREMAAANPIWGEAGIAGERLLKLRIRVACPGRGRDIGCPIPPAQIPTSGITA